MFARRPLQWCGGLRLPVFVQRELASISSNLSPVKQGIKDLFLHQEEHNKKAVNIDGSMQTVVSIDQIDEATVAAWFFEMIPTIVRMTASATFFYLKSSSGDKILVKYPADLDMSLGDNVAITGFFSAHAVAIETEGLLGIKREEAFSPQGEPFVTTLLVRNKTKEKTEYIRTTP